MLGEVEGHIVVESARKYRGKTAPPEGVLGTEAMFAQQEPPSPSKVGQMEAAGCTVASLRRVALEVEHRACTDAEFGNHKNGPLDGPPPQTRGADSGRLAHRVHAPNTRLCRGNGGGALALPYRRPVCRHVDSLGEDDPSTLLGRPIMWQNARYNQETACFYRAVSAPRHLATRNRIGTPHDGWDKYCVKAWAGTWYEVQAKCPTHVVKALT